MDSQPGSSKIDTSNKSGHFFVFFIPFHLSVVTAKWTKLQRMAINTDNWSRRKP